MSRSDKRVAVFARKRWHGIYAVTEGADVADIANISFTIVGETLAAVTTLKNKRFLSFVGACIARPLIGNSVFLKINRYDRTARLIRADT